MDITDIPMRLAVRLDTQDRLALATVAASIVTPHRRTPTVTDTVRVALSIAAGVVKAQGTTGALVGESA